MRFALVVGALCTGPSARHIRSYLLHAASNAQPDIATCKYAVYRAASYLLQGSVFEDGCHGRLGSSGPDNFVPLYSLRSLDCCG